MPDFNNNAAIVINVQDKKRESYSYASQTLQGFVLERNKWCLAYALVNLPPLKNNSDELSIYVFNTEHKVYIDDMEVLFGIPQ